MRCRLITSLLMILSAFSVQAETLTEIYESALQNDPVLRAARATYLAGEEDRNLGRANLLPQIAISGSYTETDTDIDSRRLLASGLDASQKGNNENDSTAWQISLDQALFDLPSWYKFQRGKSLSKSAEAQFASDQQDLIVRVTDAYLSVLRYYDTLQSRLAEERAIQRQLEQTRERFQVGLLPITDVHEAQAAYDEAVVNSLESRGDLSISFEKLAVLTGQNYRVLAGLAAKFPILPPEETADEWADFALQNNFELEVAKLGKDVAYEDAKAAAAQRYPKLMGNLSYSESDSDGSFEDDVLGVTTPSFSNQNGHSFEVSLNIPIWLGGSLDAQRRKSKQLSIKAAEDYQSAQRTTVQSARSLHQLVVTNAARVKARHQAIISAESALEATQAGYEVGTRNIVDVLDAERTLHQAQRNFADARYDYILSRMRLKEVAGQLSPDDIYQLNAWLDPQLIIDKAMAQ